MKKKLVWTAAANGKFSVKSAYHLAREGNTRYGGENLDSGYEKILEENLEGASSRVETLVRDCFKILSQLLRAICGKPSGRKSPMMRATRNCPQIVKKDH